MVMLGEELGGTSVRVKGDAVKDEGSCSNANARSFISEGLCHFVFF